MIGHGNAAAAEAKAQIVEVFERASEQYDQIGVDYFRTFGRRLVELTSLNPGERVLDVGCGRGAVLFPAAERVGATGQAIGIDLAAGMVSRTADEARRRGLSQVDVRIDDAESPDVPLGWFHAVFAGFVLFFMPDLRAVLERYRHMLYPGGSLAVSWFGGDDERWHPVFEAAWSYLPADRRPADHRTGDSPWRAIASLEAVMRDAGLEPMTTEETYDIRFPTPEHFWRWTRSHGMLQRWEEMPQERHALARADAEGVMDGVREADGSLSMHTQVRYTIARPARGQ